MVGDSMSGGFLTTTPETMRHVLHAKFWTNWMIGKHAASKLRDGGTIEQTPVGRAGQVNDVAAAVHYLASPEASFVTGEVLNVNGGWLFGH